MNDLNEICCDEIMPSKKYTYYEYILFKNTEFEKKPFKLMESADL